MRILSKRLGKSLLAALTVATLISGSAWADGEKKEAVGKIIDIDGPQLKTNRLADGDRWFQAYPSMTTLFKERLEADPKTSATIAFFVGGKAVVSPGTRVEVLDKDVIKVESGTVWAKFDPNQLKGQGKKFSIQTSGGVMGIEGTEFLVTTDPVTKKTQLVVVEGTVDVSGSKVTGGNEATFGDQALTAASYVAAGSPEYAIRDAAFSKLSPETRDVMRPIVNQALWYIPGRFRLGRFFYGRGFGIASNVLWAARDPRNAAISMVTARVPVGGGFLGGALRKATEPAKKPSDLHFADGKFTWDGSKGTNHYAVIVANDSESQDVVWYGLTKGDKTQLEYPSYGPELTQGQYYYVTVASLDEDGKPRANKENGVLTYQTSFSSPGHTPTYGKVEGVSTKVADAAPPSSSWKKFKEANSYRVYYKSGENTVWAGDTQSTDYTFPEAARSLAAGDYQVVVEAYDATGLKMAESAPSTFATTGWSATGLDGLPRGSEANNGSVRAVSLSR